MAIFTTSTTDNPIGPLERTLENSINDLSKIVGEIEDKLYTQNQVREGVTQKTPMPMSKVQQSINTISNLTERLREVRNQLPL